MSRPLHNPKDPSVQPGQATPPKAPVAPVDSCDLCGSEAVEWRSCKLICLSCRAIVRSCADL